MNQRESYQDKLASRLEAWRTTIQDLKARGEQVEESARAEYYESIETLSVKRDELQQQLEELKLAGEARWEELKANAENTRQAMQEEVERLQMLISQAGGRVQHWFEEEPDITPAEEDREPELQAVELEAIEDEEEQASESEPAEIGEMWVEEEAEPPYQLEEELEADEAAEAAVVTEAPVEEPPKATRREGYHLGESLLGKQLVSVNDGRIVGPIKEVHLDNELRSIKGLQIGDGGFLGLGEGGLFSRKFELVIREDVVLFGVDTVLIKDSKGVTSSDQTPELKQWVSRAKLKGRAVDTPGGTKIGTIGDLVFDDDGAIVGFRLSQVFVAGPIARKKAITRDVLVETGNESGVMTIDLTRAEQQEDLMASHL